MNVGDRVRVRKDTTTAHDSQAPCPWRRCAGEITAMPGTLGHTSTTLKRWDCDVWLDGTPTVVGFNLDELEPE